MFLLVRSAHARSACGAVRICVGGGSLLWQFPLYLLQVCSSLYQ